MPILTDDTGEEFKYVAHPQDGGSGFSYTIQMSDKPGDSIHVDTKRDTVFTDDEICAVRAYFQMMRGL